MYNDGLNHFDYQYNLLVTKLLQLEKFREKQQERQKLAEFLKEALECCIKKVTITARYALTEKVVAIIPKLVAISR